MSIAETKVSRNIRLTLLVLAQYTVTSVPLCLRGCAGNMILNDFTLEELNLPSAISVIKHSQCTVEWQNDNRQLWQNFISQWLWLDHNI